jgi:hypothetical protein
VVEVYSGSPNVEFTASEESRVTTVNALRGDINTNFFRKDGFIEFESPGDFRWAKLHSIVEFRAMEVRIPVELTCKEV